LPPDDIDYVLCTHLHADHVGWNTRLLDGRWVPTFPNARYLFAREEWEHWRVAELRARYTTDPYYEDSLLPVIESGRAEFVALDYAFDDSVWGSSCGRGTHPVTFVSSCGLSEHP
jgi:glyoxylase-like metal-dependent hydrolase (beta-lactamase superfamily II)